MSTDSALLHACRFCHEPLRQIFVDLGLSPLCQNHIEPRALSEPESFYPLQTWVCEKCFLAQLPEHVAPREIFEEYAYFSSYSETWLAHARQYVGMISERLRLGPASLVVEIGSNDGYLLQNFVAHGIPAMGIEPARNVAEVAEKKGIPTVTEFFRPDLARRLAGERGKADLILGNNVLAHVPALNDFVAGMKILLGPQGVVTMEFPHLIRLIDEGQFDTIYHEHYSYFSFTTVERVFAAQGLTLFDVDELPTHGGSLRIYARHVEDATRMVSDKVTELKRREQEWGVSNLDRYREFGERVRKAKHGILHFLIEAKANGKSIVGYGAPGKGNTLLNYCGIRTDFLDYTVDRNPYKQGKYTPGTRIPIRAPEWIKKTRPDYLFILPWNLKDEIIAQNSYIREWGGRFAVPIPELQVYE